MNIRVYNPICPVDRIVRYTYHGFHERCSPIEPHLGENLSDSLSVFSVFSATQAQHVVGSGTYRLLLPYKASASTSAY